MNERIFDMARQKGATDEQGNRAENVFCFTKDELKGFVELIVRECANKQLSLASNYEVTAAGYEPAFPEFVEGTVNGLREGAEFIKQHFGVEE